MTRDDTVAIHDHQDIFNIEKDYLIGLYHDDNNVDDLMPIINEISLCISFGDNAILFKPFSIFEFKKAFFKWILINHLALTV